MNTPSRPRDEHGIAFFAAAFAVAGGGALVLAITKAAQGHVADSVIAAVIAIIMLVFVKPAHAWSTARRPEGRRGINWEG